ncbi:3-hydroxyacyl-CoA dehydrogenase [Jiulongibacter sediminis]|uniref:3-hydroxy-2-methylbutyryl-CoA dehydrogenase n=1 Tax=Jiulongibacter sediminis TaxID=1605367 RepID=A0A0P7BN68_9BACT|nr:3-hydroxyacyl-CoA dehydrogenase [Jiulongibacter sediminis]KPM46771.1 3-hydroxy-2-methylbutyryl-CoA dehydrogenase [Jiulongibacter sediminis]TBX21675.1 3-hydroxy-2-methylbutyryl-CoA dehydrogenase [Jiulongibacter sediminis]
MKIENRVFIITGGASGLGRATAEAILEKGGNVCLIDIKTEEGEAFASENAEHILFQKADVRSEEEVQKAVDETLKKFGRIDGLVNCAGIGPPKRVVGKEGPHPLDFFKNVVDINLVGTFNCIRLVVNEIQHNEPGESGERGVIINTASVAAFDGQIGQAAYSASKGGIVAMTLPIAREFARMGVRVNTIAPGIFETPLLAGLSPEVQESLGQQVPFPQRLGKPSEYAQLAIQIIENQMLNAETIRLDGAIRMAAK